MSQDHSFHVRRQVRSIVPTARLFCNGFMYVVVAYDEPLGEWKSTPSKAWRSASDFLQADGRRPYPPESPNE